jgi:hypothetical protein
MPFRTFTDGEVLTGPLVQDYLMEQTIAVVTSGTRPASPNDGQFAYETDTDRLVKSNGVGWEIVAGNRTSYAPTVTATTTGPTLGSGSTASGFYSIGPGQLVNYTFFIQFGASGVSAGSGQYLISLPFTAANLFGSNQPAIGSAMIRDNSGPTIQSGVTYIPGSNLQYVSVMVGSPAAAITNSSPWTWAASDYIAGSIAYYM